MPAFEEAPFPPDPSQLRLDHITALLDSTQPLTKGTLARDSIRALLRKDDTASEDAANDTHARLTWCRSPFP